MSATERTEARSARARAEFTRDEFLAAVARGAAVELDASLSCGREAVACAADYLDHCWMLASRLGPDDVEELEETAAMIAADLFRQHRLRSA